MFLKRETKSIMTGIKLDDKWENQNLFLSALLSQVREKNQYQILGHLVILCHQPRLDFYLHCLSKEKTTKSNFNFVSTKHFNYQLNPTSNTGA